MLTESGVYAYGVSTNDLADDIADSSTAYGLGLPQDPNKGEVEIRVAKSNAGTVTNAALILKNMGISWDATQERPPIFETFLTTQGRVVQKGNSLVVDPLPPSSDLEFYDFAYAGRNAKQAHYANNAYFPRAEPSRCISTPCKDKETQGIKSEPGNWRSADGARPDVSTVTRLHSDGDLHAGDAYEGYPGAVPLENGRYALPMAGGNVVDPLDGLGTPYPGFKGYRNFTNRSFQHVNLSAWETQDTVEIVEYTGSSEDCRNQEGKKCVEHNKMRRGMVAFGNLTAPNDMPTSGTARYVGKVYGWYVDGKPLDSGNLAYPDSSRKNDVYPAQGNVLVSVDYTTGEAQVSISRTVIYDGGSPEIDFANINPTLKRIPLEANSTLSNYASGSFERASDTTKAGMSVRYFGQKAAEMGGTFTMRNPAGETIVGGFIARKR